MICLDTAWTVLGQCLDSAWTALAACWGGVWALHFDRLHNPGRGSETRLLHLERKLLSGGLLGGAAAGAPPQAHLRRTAGAPPAPRPPPPPSPAGGWAGWPGANLKLDLSLTESVRLRSLLKISRGPHLCLGGGLWAAGRSLSWTGRSPPWRAVPPAPTRAFVKF